MQLTDEMIYELAPFARTLGMQAEESTPSRVRVRLPHRPELSTIGGGMHGGALGSLCDLSAAICGGLNAPEGHFAATSESTTYFLKPLHGASAIASARPIRVGRTLVYVEIDVYNEAGEHCVRTTQYGQSPGLGCIVSATADTIALSPRWRSCCRRQSRGRVRHVSRGSPLVRH